MRLWSCFAAALWGWSLGAGGALASDCARDLYDHNGSLMEIEFCDGGSVVIEYVEPRPGLQKAGVESGTVLFKGSQAGDGKVSGKATIFDRKCGALTYPVAGEAVGDALILNGAAPVRGADCKVKRYREDELAFAWKGAEVQEPPAGAGSGNGDWYAIAAASRNRAEAQAKANRLGSGWFVMKTDRCPNFTKGLWIATAGPHDKVEAEAYAGGPSSAYIKRCH
ncbi:hypothetical protein [Methyloligella solikamskensis]|uniref:SPOR domain-containing protein n=1 Tax=Methyloligella solikamskensis TaxID=1177756 RepID=A0ABW3J993_9HYPH